MKRKKTDRQKGNDYQVWIKNWLQDREWMVRNFPMNMRPLFIPDEKRPGQTKMIWKAQDNDVFGCDLIARKDGRMLWIQASLDDHIARRLDTFARYFDHLSPDEALMLWIKREKWHSVKRIHVDPTGIMTITELGKIEAGKFAPEQGISPYFFGVKEKKEKK